MTDLELKILNYVKENGGDLGLLYSYLRERFNHTGNDIGLTHYRLRKNGMIGHNGDTYYLTPLAIAKLRCGVL